VYIDGSASDPAAQRSWRLQLDHSLDDLRRWLDESSRTDRDELERCLGHLDILTAEFSGGIGAPGWAAFITDDRVHDAQRLPVSTPTLAVWSTGPCIAPYVRSLKEWRPVIVIVADASRATIYRYQLGELERIDVEHAHHSIVHPEHMGAPAAAGFHTGTRGTAGHDAAQRSALRGRDRLIAESAAHARELAGDDGWIVVGGTKRVTARFADALKSAGPERILELDSLDIHSSEAQIVEATRAAAARLRDADDEHRIAEIADASGAHALGSIGPVETHRALEQRSVRELYLTDLYLDDHTAEAEEAVRSALDQDAMIEEVSGHASELLNRHGGLAASLRFRTPEPPATPG
jgi:hypothetical protein